MASLRKENRSHDKPVAYDEYSTINPKDLQGVVVPKDAEWVRIESTPTGEHSGSQGASTS